MISDNALLRLLLYNCCHCKLEVFSLSIFIFVLFFFVVYVLVRLSNKHHIVNIQTNITKIDIKQENNEESYQLDEV